jgi:hypothetical protein
MQQQISQLTETLADIPYRERDTDEVTVFFDILGQQFRVEVEAIRDGDDCPSCSNGDMETRFCIFLGQSDERIGRHSVWPDNTATYHLNRLLTRRSSLPGAVQNAIANGPDNSDQSGAAALDYHFVEASMHDVVLTLDDGIFEGQTEPEVYQLRAFGQEFWMKFENLYPLGTRGGGQQGLRGTLYMGDPRDGTAPIVAQGSRGGASVREMLGNCVGSCLRALIDTVGYNDQLTVRSDPTGET